MDEPIRIVHFSDTHFTKRPQFIKESYDSAVKTINSIPHDFAIFSGDLTQDGLGDEYNYANKLKRDIISPKIYWIIGNHDSRSGGFEVWEKMVGPREFYEFNLICKRCEFFEGCRKEAKSRNGYPKYLDRKRRAKVEG